MKQPNKPGSYLVRNSDTQPGHYSLAVRHKTDVKHYLIKLDGEHFFLHASAKFASLSELLHFYSQNTRDIGIQLKTPCVVSEPPQTTGSPISTLQVEKSEVSLNRRVGDGTFGAIWEGKWRSTTGVAVRVLCESKPRVPESQLLETVHAMKNLSHPYLVRLFAVCTEEPAYVIMELMKLSLLTYLQTPEGRCNQNFIFFSSQILNGMAHLEEQNFVHKNLAARNVLMDEHFNCKVADYGLPDLFDSPLETSLVKWTAPEVLLGSPHTIKSDIWAFGIVLYEVVTHGRFPYPGMTNAQVMEKIVSGYRIPRPLNCPDILHNLMQYCWKAEPMERYTFDFMSSELCCVDYA